MWEFSSKIMQREPVQSVYKNIWLTFKWIQGKFLSYYTAMISSIQQHLSEFKTVVKL